MILNLKNEIRFWIKKKVGKINLIQNLFYNVGDNSKRVLISYSIKPFLIDLQSEVYHTNIFEILEICNSFYKRGFIVDIVDSDERLALPILLKKKYDVIFGFGDVFYEMTKFHSDVKSILYMTENHPILSRRKEQERRNYFYDRHHRRAPLSRSGIYYKDFHLKKKYDHIIVLGEASPYISQYAKVFQIYPTGLINLNFEITGDCLSLVNCKKHFLWLGSNGAIHKGLDLLIDIAKINKDIVLHICGLTPKDKSLLNLKGIDNIIDYGRVSISSDTFLEICRKCRFIILPSCSEGFSTAITTGMLHGLIPIITKDIGMNRLNNLAFYFDDFHLEVIETKLIELMRLDDLLLQKMSLDVLNYARREFTIKAYNESFNKILNQII